MERLSFEQALNLAYEMHGEKLGMFGHLRTKSGKPIAGMYLSHSLNKIITKAELLTFRNQKQTPKT